MAEGDMVEICAGMILQEGKAAALEIAEDAGVEMALDALNLIAEKRLAEVRRYRSVLVAIRDHGETHDQPCHALHRGDCADVMQEYARAALDA